ncbi:MAG TPA: hypothetical protein VH912_05390 [Streptosporangiaceae bacterium]
MTAALTRRCSSCGAQRPFEQPPCRDGHRGDCPEWACVDCGEAVLAGLPPIDAWFYDDLLLDDLRFDVERRSPGSPSQAA